jgi:hypothetical protein
METIAGMCNSFRRVIRAFPIAVALMVAAPALRADDLPWIQVAAHAGYRAGGSLEDLDTGADRDLDEGAGFAIALERRFRPGDERFYQLWYSHRRSAVPDGGADADVDIEYLHLGGTLPIGRQERAQPYFAAGLGVTRFAASATGSADETRVSGSMAVGVELPIGERAAFRLEARGYLTAVDSDRAIFCRSDNGSGFCRIAASGSTLFQAEALAGIALRF